MDFHIMTWNVENLFRPSITEPDAESAYVAKLGSLSVTIRHLNPDVIALQEVGSAASLEDLQRALGGSYPHTALSDHPDRRGIRVAFLSKVELSNPKHVIALAPNPVLAIQNHQGAPVTRLRRGALTVTIRVAERRIHIITAHLKSKLLDFPTPGGGSAFSTDDESLRASVASLALAERTAEAVTLRAEASALIANHPTDAVIVLGDLNDVPEAATTQILQGPHGSQPGTGGFDRPDKGDHARLFNLAGFIPAERRYSRINGGVRELIDHILVSEELVPLDSAGRKRARPTVNSYPELQGGIQSVGTDPAKRRNEVASDHAPVMARFAL